MIVDLTYLLCKILVEAEKNSDTELWIASSMGQEAVPNYKPGDSFWNIYDLELFLSSLCQDHISVKTLPQMIPCYSVEADQSIIIKCMRIQ